MSGSRGWLHATTLVVTVTALAISTPSSAQNAEQERTALYRDGSAAVGAGKWDVAADKFRKVVEIRSAPKALIALAIAEEHLGHLDAAKHDYDKAITDARTAQLADDEAAASQALAALAPRVPVIAVRVPNTASVTSVTLDGKTIPTSDAEYDVDPGQHTIVAHGASEFREVVDVKEGEHVSVSIDIAGAHAAPQVMTVRSNLAPSKSSVSVGAVTFGAVGVVGVGIASVLWAVGQGQQSDVQSQCGGETTNCPLSSKPEADSARTNIIAGDVLFGIGAALAAAGATWLVVSLVGHGKGATAAAWISPSGLGVSGTW